MITRIMQSKLGPVSLAVLLSLLLTGCFGKAVQDIIVSGDRTLAGGYHWLLKEEGTTELMLQSARGNIEKVKAELAGGADPNEKNVNGHTALMFAAENGNLTILKMLLDYGADPDTQDAFGRTALFLAAHERPKDRKQSVGDWGEASHLLGPEGRKAPLGPYIGENNHTGVIDYLISIDAPVYESLEFDMDAEYTGRAFFNIAHKYHQDQKYALARDYYEVAMRSFIEAAVLYQRQVKIGKQIDRSFVFYSVVLTVTETLAGRTAGPRPQYPTPLFSSSDNRDVILMKTNQERAVLVGVMIGCYENEAPDDGLTACLEEVQEAMETCDDESVRACASFAHRMGSGLR